MLKLILLSTIQSIFLVLSQIFLKFAVNRMGEVRFSYEFFKGLLKNWQFACSGISIVIATLLWMYILRNFEFSAAYPLISISCIFGVLAAVFLFHEAIPFTRWIGLAFIIVGVIFVAR